MQGEQRRVNNTIRPLNQPTVPVQRQASVHATHLLLDVIPGVEPFVAHINTHEVVLSCRLKGVSDLGAQGNGEERGEGRGAEGNWGEGTEGRGGEGRGRKYVDGGRRGGSVE